MPRYLKEKNEPTDYSIDSRIRSSRENL